ncbi:MAG: hypothetical protein HY920_05420 [Elusimicrobia bacterium]|nr:hypothetical protein [Elusimicrobiota bacterium]
MAEDLSVALDHLKNNFIEVSIREFQIIIKKAPENFQAHLFLSRALEKKANLEQTKAFYFLALAEAKLALKHSAGLNKEIHQQLINLYHQCGQLDVASVEYKKYAANNPGHEFFIECLKQIATLSAFKIAVIPRLDTGKKDNIIGLFLLVLVIGVLIFIVLFGVLKYFQMNTPLK